MVVMMTCASKGELVVIMKVIKVLQEYNDGVERMEIVMRKL